MNVDLCILDSGLNINEFYVDFRIKVLDFVPQHLSYSYYTNSVYLINNIGGIYMHNMKAMQNVSPTSVSPTDKTDSTMGIMYPLNLLQTIQHCAITCDHMITHMLFHEDINNRRTQLQLLRDCSDICHLTVSVIARKSHLGRMMAQVCAYICEVCGNECSKFMDHHSQDCARVCLHCSQECHSFAMSGHL